MRRLMQRGLRPFVLRLYDELDTLVAARSHGGGVHAGHAQGAGSPHGIGGPHGPHGIEGGALDEWLDALGGRRARSLIPTLRRRLAGFALEHAGLSNRLVDAIAPRLSGGCLLVVGVEGDRALADGEWRAVERELLAAGGRDLGPGPGERWLRDRYAISFNMSKAFHTGAFVDTMEVATTWERLMDLYTAVRQAVAPHAFVMAHFSHAYPDGCSIYFTFAAAAGDPADRARAEHRYDAIWRAGLSAATAAGATLSHHHGIGVLKAAFMPEEHGDAMRVFEGLKDVFDPHRIMNPGKLGLAAEVGAGSGAIGEGIMNPGKLGLAAEAPSRGDGGDDR
jgi:alkyldihydroxyacetonephosphate synthase